MKCMQEYNNNTTGVDTSNILGVNKPQYLLLCAMV